MNVSEKLELQRKFDGVLLFKEGVFLRAYAESCYLLTQHFRQLLKVQCTWIKCLNKWVISCAFPENKLKERLPEAKITEFGASLSGTFNLKGYHRWFKLHCQRANEASKLIITRKVNSEEPTQSVIEKAEFHLPITEKQLTFLFNWQKNHYPLELEQAFLASLQRALYRVL